MKKIRLITLLVLTLIFTLLLLVGCKKDDKIASISLKDNDPNAAVEIAVGDFDYGAYTVIVTYESGNTEEIALTQDMISATDHVKFFAVGEHDITVSYGKQVYTFKVSVKQSTFEGLSFPKNNVFTYDGRAHIVEVEGTIPANAVVTYSGGNSFVNAGTYDVTAVVSCDGYVTERLSTTVTIERAKYDMSGITFEAKEFIYDGTAHSVAISGTLPEGVSLPTYTINEKQIASATDVGEYTVKATFANDNPNYEAIPDMVTTIKIIPAEYNVKGIDIVFKNEDGKLIDGTAKVYDGKSITFDLNDYSELPKNASVSFCVTDKDGKVISNSNKNTGIKNAGIYIVKVEFTLADSKNYKSIAPIVCEFEVITAEYPAIENIEFLSDQVTYDGNAHSIEISRKLEGVTVSYEYYLNNSLVLDSEGKAAQSVTDAGRYTVKAIFTHADENRGSIPTLTAILNIEKIKVDASMFGFYGASSMEYTGTPYEPNFLTWKDANGAEHDILNYSEIKYYVFDSSLGAYVEMSDTLRPTDIGVYRFVITVSIAEDYEDNYCFQGGENRMELISDFKIVSQKINAPRITFHSNPTLEYTGTAQNIVFTQEISSELMTISTAYFHYTSNGYEPMESGQIPTNVGSYRFVVTVSINEESELLYVFPNGESHMEFPFDFEIQKKVIEVPQFKFDGNETAIPYDENKHTVVFTSTELPEVVALTTTYFKWDGEKYEAMNADELPVNTGTYKFVVRVSINDTSNYIFSGEQNVVESVFGFKIEKAKLNTPMFTLPTDEIILYSGNPYRVDYSWTEDSGLITVSKAYYHLVAGKYEPMDEGEYPTDAGSYKFVITASVNEPEYYIFSNNQTVVEGTYVFKIEKNKIDAPEWTLSISPEIMYNTQAKPVEFSFTADLEHVTVSTAYYQLIDGEYVPMPEGEIPTNVGKYKFVATASIKDTEWYTFADEQTTLVEECVYEIKAIELAVPEFTFTSDKELTYNGSSRPVDFTYTNDSELITMSTEYFKTVDGNYVLMDAGQLPTNADSYKFKITVTVNNENYIFATDAEDKTTIVVEYEFVIHKYELDVMEFTFETQPNLTYNGEDQPIRFTHNAPAFTVEVVGKYYKKVNGVYVELGEGELPCGIGEYKLTITASVMDPENYIFSNETIVKTVTRLLTITTNILEDPELTILNEETKLVYNGEARPVVYEEVEPSNFFTVTTVYYQFIDGEYVPMAAGEIPKNAGKYQGVVVAEIIDRDNCIFTSGAYVVTSDTFEFEIERLVIDVPTLTVTGDQTLVYNGQERPAQIACTVDSKYITITTVYKRYDGNGNEVAMDTDHPLHVGSYKCSVTAEINDPNCIFADETDKVEAEVFEYSIYEYVIDMAEMGIGESRDNRKLYNWTGADLRFKLFEDLDFYKTKGFITWDVAWETYAPIAQFVNNEWTTSDNIDTKDVGIYMVRYTIKVLNSSSCALLYNGEKVTEITIDHYFEIVNKPNEAIE